MHFYIIIGRQPRFECKLIPRNQYLPMMHTFTPTTTRDNERTDLKIKLPSQFSLKVIMGYSAALKVIELKSLGTTEILMN